MRKTVRKALCLTLILSQFGCRSVYRFQCTCDPSPAGVLVGEEMVGETECTVDVPRDSDWIQDGKIEFTFCLPDGRERRRIVDLHGLKPSNPLAETVAAPFMLLGGGAFFLALADNDHENENRGQDDDGDKGDNLLIGLAGLGVALVGVGLYHLLGGDTDSLSAYEVHLDFNEPGDGQKPQDQK